MSRMLNIRDLETGKLLKVEDLPSEIYYTPPPKLAKKREIVEQFLKLDYGTIAYDRRLNSITLLEPALVHQSDPVHEERSEAEDKDETQDCVNIEDKSDEKGSSHQEDVTMEKKMLLIRPYECGMCYVRYESKHDLMRHIRYHDLINNGKPLQCLDPGCQQSFTDGTDFHNHLHNAHNSTPRICGECGKMCKGSGYWRVHTRTHHPGTWKSVIGNLRPDIVDPHQTKAALLEVEKAEHGRQKKRTKKKQLKRLECPRRSCSRTFANRTNLGKHIVCHLGDAINCLYCGHPFWKISMLRSHIDTYHREANEKDDREKMKTYALNEFVEIPNTCSEKPSASTGNYEVNSTSVMEKSYFTISSGEIGNKQAEEFVMPSSDINQQIDDNGERQDWNQNQKTMENLMDNLPTPSEFPDLLQLPNDWINPQNIDMNLDTYFSVGDLSEYEMIAREDVIRQILQQGVSGEEHLEAIQPSQNYSLMDIFSIDNETESPKSK